MYAKLFHYFTKSNLAKPQKQDIQRDLQDCSLFVSEITRLVLINTIIECS